MGDISFSLNPAGPEKEAATFKLVSSMKDFTRFMARDLRNGKIFRAVKEEPLTRFPEICTVFVYPKRCRRWGWRYNSDHFSQLYEVIETKAEAEDKAWHKRLKRCIKAMEESGLWLNTDVYKTFVNLEKMTLEDKKAIYYIYFNTKYENGKMLYDWNALEPYVSKYPWIVGTDMNGEKFLHTSYFYELSDCKTKTIYFGKWVNKQDKETIKRAIAEKRNLTIRETAGYDVSFELKFKDSDGNTLSDPRAWYSEEYRNCGNGHYYLAINENLAVFCEND